MGADAPTRPTLKERLKADEAVFGTWCLIPSPEVIDVLAAAGLDFVLIDMEHGPMDFATAMRMATAASSRGCEPVIRVPYANEADVLRALDTGAAGVVVPHVETPEARRQAVSWMKYPPAGVRGFSPYTRAGGYASRPGHTLRENERTLAGILVETTEGIANLPAILDDPRLDLVYVGTYDLSVALGLPGDVKHPKVRQALRDAVKLARAAGKAAGCLFHDAAEREEFLDMGIRFLCYRVDSAVLHDGFASIKG
jgi:4-hydroxy-2-oxoheptanedioate aldolase